MTTHALERMLERSLAIREFGGRVNVAYLARFLAHAAPRFRSAALLLADVPFTGQAWSPRSNGNQLWAVVRHGRVRTVLLRRDTQPVSGLRTDRVLDAREYVEAA